MNGMESGSFEFQEEEDNDEIEETKGSKKEKEFPWVDKLENSFGLLPQEIREIELGTDLGRLMKKIKGAYTNLGAFPELDDLSEELNSLISNLNEDEDSLDMVKTDLDQLKQRADSILE